ncbi:DUF4190 domain-containing protein [Aeromicrobium piscarium]|uniref:DUF4190 domain-containing protein n=1 Tax=Aeromicrobium piscarium TaxID=2590901 RepID=A0A554SBC4_9ACTN|nr:DUF4190 domain-containing protein [Aeromicrobium piscarium]TSD63645.1 DUF4190 domain-containing protein [Aeromicrobium piscarium]
MSSYPTAPQGNGDWRPPEKHPQSTLALVLGILGLVICSILGPFAWYIGGKAVSEIDASGGRYEGRSEANAGKILGIIGTVLLGLGVLMIIAVVFFGFLGVMASSSSSTY